MSPCTDSSDSSAEVQSAGNTQTASSQNRDWCSLAKVDTKPLNPIEAHIHSTSQKGLVSSQHPLATDAALWALQRGGSAVDAYITAALAHCVLEPTMTSLGGGFWMNYWDARKGQLFGLDGAFAFPEALPAELPFDEFKAWTGWATMVPGFVRGVELAHKSWGRLPWRELFEPAIAFAEDGFVVDHQLWGWTYNHRELVGRYPGAGREIWFPKGSMLGVGEVLQNPFLARTLQRLRDEGADYFYTGDFAKKLVQAVGERGGAISLADLKNFRAAKTEGWIPSLEAGASKFRDFIVGPPSITMIQLAFNLFEIGDLRAMGHPSQSTDALYHQIRIMQEIWAQGLTNQSGDFSEFSVFPDSEWHQRSISKEFAQSLWKEIEGSPPRPFDGYDAGTCALAIVDAEGNIVSGDHSTSSTSYGSGINLEGVILNRAVFGRKYKLPRGISTSAWLFRDGKPAFTMATPSRSFTECVLQVTANVVEYGMSLADAVKPPRFGHPHPGLGAIEIEGDFPENVLSEVQGRGIELFPVTPMEMNMGSAQAIFISEDGIIEGVADPRRRGKVAGLQPLTP